MPAVELPADLSASHDLLHALLEVSLPGIILARPVYAADAPATILDLACVQLNPAAQQMLGQPARPAETLLTLFPHLRETGAFAFYRDSFLSGRPGEYAVNYPYDGLDNFFMLSARRCGELLVIGFTDTATQERSWVEQALRASQAREQTRSVEAETRRTELEGVFAQAPVGLVLFQGPEYRIDLANSMMGHIWGRPVAQVLGQPVFEAMPDLKQQGFEAILADVYQRGIPYSLWELPVTIARTHTGQAAKGFYNVVYQPHRDGRGDIVAIVCLVIEVTDQVVARQQAQALNEQLHATNEELETRVLVRTQELTRTNVDLDSFIYTASHDLKAPIANIEGLLELLRQELPADVRQAGLVPRVLSLMQESVERFRLTIAQLTDITRLQQVRTEPSAAADLAAALESVRLDLAPLLEATDTQLTVAVEPKMTVQLAPQQLRSILYNLLSNAVKYRHPDRVPKVHLRCRRVDHQAVLEVQDNGLGLTPAQQGQLFGLFRRLHAHVEGTGVGLYMVKRIVENASGTIQVRSESGVGSTFTVCLPA